MKTQNHFSIASLASRLSLATRLYSIFALFALLTAAITALSDYNTHRAAELTESIEVADQAALNVERGMELLKNSRKEKTLAR